MPQNRLRELRTEQGMSMKEVGDQLGVHQSTVSRWETYVTQIPDRRKPELAEMLGVSVPFLMRWADE